MGLAAVSSRVPTRFKGKDPCSQHRACAEKTLWAPTPEWPLSGRSLHGSVSEERTGKKCGHADLLQDLRRARVALAASMSFAL